MYKFDGYVWNEKKRKDTFEIRRLDISIDGPAAMTDPQAVTTFSMQSNEERYKTVAMFNGNLHTIVHTPRNGKCRIITMRRAHKDEEEAYYAN